MKRLQRHRAPAPLQTKRPPRRGWLMPGYFAATLLLIAALTAGRFGSAHAACGADAPTPEQLAFFEAKVRPVLAANCLSCHNADEHQGGVRLDTAAEARKVLVPGDPEKSRLIQVIRYTGAKRMPPSGKRPDVEIAALTAWVKMGAPWTESKNAAAASTAAVTDDTVIWKDDLARKHWAFQPVRNPAVPPIKNSRWAASPIDSFVVAKLEAKHLLPAPPADRRTLIRRVYFDLIGLPPAPDAVAKFLADKSEDAYAKVVDSLLASPQYGERWARHWLDVARYADSNGLDENLAYGAAWRYRDWVVRALNADKPYSLFLQEQIAGDLMGEGVSENIRNDRRTATGFLVLGPKVLAEQDKPKLVMDIVDEQIDVTCKATMGLTIACARCHDHKFDPISTRDYYALAGLFKSTKTMRDLGFVSRWNERDLPTQALEVEMKAAEARVKPLEHAATEAQNSAQNEIVAALHRDSEKYLKAGWEFSQQPGVLLPRAEVPRHPGDPERHILFATAYDKGNANRDRDNFGKDVEEGVIDTNTATVNAEWNITLPSDGTYQIDIRYASEESRPLTLLVNGKAVKPNACGGITGSWKADTQQWEAQGVYPFHAGVNRIGIERSSSIPHLSRLCVTAAALHPASKPGAVPLTADAIAKRDNLIPAVVTRWASHLIDTTSLAEARARTTTETEVKSLYALPPKPEQHYSLDAKDRISKSDAALAEARKSIPQVPVAMAVEENTTPENVPVHIRGNTQSLGEIVPRGYPAVLVRATCAPGTFRATPHGLPTTEKGSGRLVFARWLTSGKHPLTARVAVNRIWQHLFGAGLVRTPDNWGIKGEPPTHPELLDYLASEFMRGGWSQKRLIRQIVLSATYRMDSASPKMAATANLLDPENRLLWHMNRRRLEAEPFRDAILSVAGTLDPTPGGNLLASHDGDYVTDDQSRDNGQYLQPRRSIYLPIVRNSIYDLFSAFDFGDGSTQNAHRASTTVAPQALYILNSPLTRDAALAWAHSLLTSGEKPAATDAARVQAAYQRAFSRPATPGEVNRALAYQSRYQAALATREPDAAKRRERAWQSYCQALFAANEFIYVN